MSMNMCMCPCFFYVYIYIYTQYVYITIWYYMHIFVHTWDIFTPEKVGGHANCWRHGGFWIRSGSMCVTMCIYIYYIHIVYVLGIMYVHIISYIYIYTYTYHNCVYVHCIYKGNVHVSIKHLNMKSTVAREKTLRNIHWVSILQPTVHWPSNEQPNQSICHCIRQKVTTLVPANSIVTGKRKPPVENLQCGAPVR